MQAQNVTINTDGTIVRTTVTHMGCELGRKLIPGGDNWMKATDECAVSGCRFHHMIATRKIKARNQPGMVTVTWKAIGFTTNGALTTYNHHAGSGTTTETAEEFATATMWTGTVRIHTPNA